MKVIIKKSVVKDYFPTENVTREAFWNVYNPGCDEHLILHKIRKSECYIPELDLVAVWNRQIIGHVICTKAKVVDGKDVENNVLSLGPISVLPEFQNRQVGSELMNFSLMKAEELGYNAVILFGNPVYYHRFGFRNAAVFNITTKDFQNFDEFMALELKSGSLDNVKGYFQEDNAFLVEQKELIKFDKQFQKN